MLKNCKTKAAVYLLILTTLTISSNDGAKNTENSRGDSPTSPWQDFLKNTGVADILSKLAGAIADKIQEAQRYDNFNVDWELLKEEPLNPMKIYQFIKNTSLPFLVRVGMVVQKYWRSLHFRVMNFTLKKCDVLFGREASYHPWNVMKQGKEQVSFVVFVYAGCLSLILFKLCSFWNFLGWLAMGYLAYSSAGPYWCFQWLVFVTGFFWFIFDLVLAYPIHAALTFLALYLLPYIYSTLFVRSVKFVPQTARIDEIRMLNRKVSKIEDKTEEIEKKVDELENLFQRMNFDK